MSQNYLGFYDLETIEVSPGVGAWRVKCHRCYMEAQTTRDGPYKICPDLTMLINRHVCDPDKRGQQAVKKTTKFLDLQDDNEQIEKSNDTRASTER